MSLPVGQWELGGVAFGEGTQISVNTWDVGVREFRVQDQPNPFGDGVVHGRDEISGRAYTWELTCEGRGGDPATDARSLERALSAAWRGDPYRKTPGAYTQLRTNVWGDGAKRLVGRARNYKPLVGNTKSGLVKVTAEFAAVDDLVYSDTPVTITTGLFAQADTGLAGPWVDPLSDSGTAAVSPGVVNDIPGDIPTRLIEVEFVGPATHPGIEIVGVGTVTLRMSLSPSQIAKIYLHPSLRKATINGSGDVSGFITGDVDVFALPPGTQEVRYVATNLTGTSDMTFTAYPAFVSA